MKIEDVIVKTVETQELIEFLAIKLNENEQLRIGRFAVFEDKFAIDTDCCFGKIQNQHFNDEIQPVIEIECRIKKRTKDGCSIRMDKPDFVKTISLKDYFKLSKEVALIDFIRYNYNPRIERNQRLLMKYINNTNTET